MPEIAPKRDFGRSNYNSPDALNNQAFKSD